MQGSDLKLFVWDSIAYAEALEVLTDCNQYALLFALAESREQAIDEILKRFDSDLDAHINEYKQVGLDVDQNGQWTRDRQRLEKHLHSTEPLEVTQPTGYIILTEYDTEMNNESNGD